MRSLLISTFLLVLMVSVSASLAAGVSLQVTKSNPIVFTEETTGVDVVIANSQSSRDTFTLTIFNPLPGEIAVTAENFLIELGSNEQKSVRVDFTPSLYATPQIVEFSLSAISTKDSSVNDTKSVFLNIQRKTPVFIRELSLEKNTLNPGEEVKITAKVFNLKETSSEKHFLKITVKKGTTVIRTFDESLDSIGPKSSVDVMEKFDLDKYAAPGSYVVDAELRDASNELKYSKSTNFNVNTVTQPPTEYTKKSSSYTVLFSSVTIKVKNEGNVELPASIVTESLPKFAQTLFDPEIEPTTTDSSVSRVVYTWSVPALAPGGEYTIPYKVDLWKMWLTLAIIGGIGYGAYKWLSKPRIGKSVRHQGEISRGKEVVVLLEVKNRALHEIKDVEIIDVVPQIARVVDRFDTLRPKARRVEGGTELRWQMGSMRAGEERVLTYRIRPVVDIVGHLNLPQAQMTFLDRRKVKRMSASKQTLVKAQ